MSVIDREQEIREPVREARQEAATHKVLQGKKALVTGGSRGIGKATVLALAAAGADVAINFQQCNSSAEEVCLEARELDVHANIFQADICARRKPNGWRMQCWTNSEGSISW